jgi:drug/metabolite transporter superfamily protein YnfA
MTYSPEALTFLVILLFATGVWVESQDADPQIRRAAEFGGAFVLIGAMWLWYIDSFGPLF